MAGSFTHLKRGSPRRGGAGRSCRRLAGVAAAAAVWACASTAPAQDAKPKHAFQAGETMLRELELMYEADLRSFEVPAIEEVPGRMPRHALMEARRVYESTQSLRFLNGLERKELSPVPVRRIHPDDVRDMADRAVESLRELRDIYGIEAAVEEPPLRDGTTPSDVVVKYRELQAALRGLGVPAIVPNDAYRRADMLANELDKVAAHYGVAGRQGVESKTSGKTPDDAYERAYRMGESLKAVIERDGDLDLPGGMVMPPHKSGEQSPADVLAITRMLLADVTAVKAQLGIDSPAEVPAPPVGRTPSDVFDVLRECAAIVARIDAKLTAG